MRDYLVIIIVLGVSLVIAQAITSVQTAKINRQVQKQAEAFQKDWRQTLVKSATSVSGLTLVGSRLLQAGQADEALAALSEATTRDQHYRDSFLWLGYGYLKNNNFELSRRALEQAGKIDPVFAPTWQLLAETYQGLGDKVKAEAAANQSKILNKN